ncbi:hypothetical protein OKJ48_00360 [Streptomyces kunmingensis]|uniref:Peptidase inhibitor family I36 n=1 Tax=Streptomyces kunmingensis TaxID=68225 RepID=A0ABU6C3D5_9ACTN|nr:hypothetical protein [Streptomyces kunmingensis]MEB3958716.1 hypothetical protein [Streptomyces kunmingensis]
MSLRKLAAVSSAIAALVAGPVLAGNASATTIGSQQAAYAQQAHDAGLTNSQAAQLQRKVDAALARQADSRQIGANKLAIPGGTLTLAAPGKFSAAIACSNGHLCIQDGQGSTWDYYYCGYYDFYGIGDGVFNNNQTSGTRARFYNSNGSERWSNVAKATGTASWTPVYHIRPC